MDVLRGDGESVPAQDLCEGAPRSPQVRFARRKTLEKAAGFGQPRRLNEPGRTRLQAIAAHRQRA